MACRDQIAKNGEVDTYLFQGRANESIIVELFGDRLGTDIDSVIEILDSEGRSIPRAILQPTDQTETAFRDHNSTTRAIRMTHWENLAINDYLLIGREVVRIQALPRNPDDDCTLWNQSGQRLAMFETTPEQHPQGQPIYKLNVLPPDAKINQGGVKPTTLTYANDDGGPGFSRDSQVTFAVPRDGDYRIQVRDARGLGGKSFGYHLVVRRPSPSFDIGFSPVNLNIPRGGTELVTVVINRRDGFDEPVELHALGVPEGIIPTDATVQPGESTGIVAFTADIAAPAFSAANWRLVATPLASPATRSQDFRSLSRGNRSRRWIHHSHAPTEPHGPIPAEPRGNPPRTASPARPQGRALARLHGTRTH